MKPTPLSNDTSIKSALQLAMDNGKPQTQFADKHRMFLQNNGFSLEDDGVYVLDLKEDKHTKLLITLQQRPIAVSLPETGLPTCEQMKIFYVAAHDILKGH